MTAGAFQGARPFDVGLLVEARFDLDDHEHLLSRLRGVDQCIDERRSPLVR